MTEHELQQLTTVLEQAIVNGFKSGFKTKDMRAFDDQGNPMKVPEPDAKKEVWDNFLAAASNQKKAEYEAEIQRKIDRLVANNGENSRLGRKKIEELKEELQRSQNGGISDNDIKKDRLNRTASIVNGITKIGTELINMYAGYAEYQMALTRANLEYRSKIEQLHLEKDSKVIAQGMKSITFGFSKNANELAYDATTSSYDLAQTNIRTAQEMKIAGKTLTKDIASAKAEMWTGMLSSGTTILGTAIGMAIAGPVGAAVGGMFGAIGGFFTNAFQKLAGVDIKRMELAIKQAELVSNLMQQYTEKFAQTVKPWDDLYKATTDFVLKLDDAGKRFGVTIGFTGDKFSNNLIDMAQAQIVGASNLAQIFGKEAEKIPEYMDNFMSSSMRNVMLSAQDLGNIMGTAKIFGMSGAESANLYGSMNVFNTSVSSASDTMGVMYHQITRMGLSSKKFGKDLVDNLKLAQKYNFRGGVDNMMKLTKWAQQTRFNLNSAASFSDKIMNGSLSEALETSAKLQVLGGNAAMYSDPLGMLYDSGVDVGSMAERMHKMFGDITGTFNSRTGETEFSWYENKMLMERAKALGMDPAEVKNMIRQSQKQGAIDKVIGNRLSEEDRTAIGNRATYNKNTGNWEVVDIKGKTHDINEYINGEADIDELLPADTQESILKVAQESLSHQEKLDNAVTDINTKLGGEKKNDIFTTVDNERQTLTNFYNNNWNNILGGWNAAREHSENMFKANIHLMGKTAEDLTLIKNIYEGFEKQITEIVDDKKMFQQLKDGAAQFKKGTEALQKWVEGLIKEKEAPPKPKSDFEYNMDKASEHASQGDYFTAAVYCQAANVTSLQKDGVGQTNGGIITSASNIKSINDGSVNVKTDRQDQYLAAMPNGPIDKILQQLIPGLQALLRNNDKSTTYSANGVNINVNGQIMLTQDGTTINLVDVMRNNPAMAMKFVKVLARASEVNDNGRPIHNYMV